MKILSIILIMYLITPVTSYYLFIDKPNINITSHFLTVKTTLSDNQDIWTTSNRDTLKIGENIFYYVVENGLSAEFKIIKY